jgi:hypothetical protein
MAQIPNQVYPQSAGEYDATEFRGSWLVLWDCVAENAVGQYQAVTVATVPGTTLMVSGSTARAGGPILGVALNAAVAGGPINILKKGIVGPVFCSGSCTIGAPVLASSSGSAWCYETYAQVGVVAYWAAVASGSTRTVIGYAVKTGSTSSGSNASFTGGSYIFVDC